MIKIANFKILVEKVENAEIVELNRGNCFQQNISNFYLGSFLDPISSENKISETL